MLGSVRPGRCDLVIGLEGHLVAADNNRAFARAVAAELVRP